MLLNAMDSILRCGGRAILLACLLVGFQGEARPIDHVVGGNAVYKGMWAICRGPLRVDNKWFCRGFSMIGVVGVGAMVEASQNDVDEFGDDMAHNLLGAGLGAFEIELFWSF